ncbi:carbamoyltransferase C-terminal domain-containing protein [Streptomyces sp. NPDC046197]|uniref:carbamoyltransferase C-terminal domain-containing protein n=1 Tax=Streptomyces sp. NPDC046197 TaxID=3154337 RepID=UPI0033EBCAB3
MASGDVVALCSGPMEFGPRVLGSRSVIADPRRADTQSRLDLKVKFRESFRPFAPAVLP